MSRAGSPIGFDCPVSLAIRPSAVRRQRERERMKLISALFFVSVTLVLLLGITGSAFDDDEEVSLVLTECK